MESELVFCPRCSRQVNIVHTLEPGHLGHANVDEGAEPVCLDLGAACDGQLCAVTGEPRIVLAVRLARSGLKETPWQVVKTYCPSCSAVRELEVLDPEHGHCPVCDATVEWPTTARNT